MIAQIYPVGLLVKTSDIKIYGYMIECPNHPLNGTTILKSIRGNDISFNHQLKPLDKFTRLSELLDHLQLETIHQK